MTVTLYPAFVKVKAEKRPMMPEPSMATSIFKSLDLSKLSWFTEKWTVDDHNIYISQAPGLAKRALMYDTESLTDF